MRLPYQAHITLTSSAAASGSASLCFFSFFSFFSFFDLSTTASALGLYVYRVHASVEIDGKVHGTNLDSRGLDVLLRGSGRGGVGDAAFKLAGAGVNLHAVLNTDLSVGLVAQCINTGLDEE